MFFTDIANSCIPAAITAPFRELDPNFSLPHRPLPHESELPRESERSSVEDWTESIMERCMDRTDRKEAVYRRMHDLRVVDVTPYQGRITGHHYAIVEITPTENLCRFEAPRIYLRIERGPPQIPFGTLLAALWVAAGGSCFTGVDTIRRVDGHPWIDSAIGKVWWGGKTNRSTLLDLVRIASFLHKECRTHRSGSATCASFAQDLCMLLCKHCSVNYLTASTAGGWPGFTVFSEVHNGASSELYARFSEYEKHENSTMVWGKDVEQSAEVVRHSPSEVAVFEPENVVAQILALMEEISLSAVRNQAAMHCSEDHFGTLGDRIDALICQRGALIERMDALIDERGVLIERMDALIGERGALIGEMGALIDRSGVLRDRVGALIDRICELIGRAVGRIRMLEARVGALEAQVGAVEARIGVLEGRMVNDR